MPTSNDLVAEHLSSLSALDSPVQVSLSNEIVHLLSDQLYQSPVKAIEELVVNSYDADAKECRVFMPSPSDTENEFVLVYDNGQGMDKDGLTNLWQIGRSNKRSDEIEKRSKRKLIGKFGIGKLATYAIAYRLTYITKSSGQILAVTVDFRSFGESPTGLAKPINVPVRVVGDWKTFLDGTYFEKALEAAGVPDSFVHQKSWTIALLEDLKPKAKEIKRTTVDWVLSTAMPLRSDFRLYCNCEEVKSSKESYEKKVEFDLSKFPKERLRNLSNSTGEDWQISGNALVSRSFPSGISGTVIVTERTLLGKSDDIIRSHGFFIRVRDRLVNEGDPLFGLKPLEHGTFNRFRADIQADDLDKTLKASRETVEETQLRVYFRTLLREIYNEANRLYTATINAEDEKETKRREGERNTVSQRLVEQPVADALMVQNLDAKGVDADETWFYIQVDPKAEISQLIQDLYTSSRTKYLYKYTQAGTTARLVQFNPIDSTFWINEDHDLVREYGQDSISRILLEDFVTAEALLEIYLRESQIASHVIGAVLERRDVLLRSLAKDHAYSLSTVAKMIRDAAGNERDLEIALVIAARGLGFVAKHISGAGQPDGVARFTDYPNGEKKIILEAKSSEDVPSLGAIDFASLAEHVYREKAHGCLLVAPEYPGLSRQEDSAAATRARLQKISCWTVEQLAKVIDAAESRQLNARNVLDIVLTKFSPDDVKGAIDTLLTEPSSNSRQLYKAILIALKQLQGRLADRHRTVDMVTTKVTDQSEFTNAAGSQIERAIQELASASQGGMTISSADRNIIIHVSQEELERRLSGLTKQPPEPRTLSSFRKNE